MFNTAFYVRSRLQRKFGKKFSVNSLNNGFKIAWSNGPTPLEVSLELRGFRETKIFVHYENTTGWFYRKLVFTEEHKTPSQLRKV